MYDLHLHSIYSDGIVNIEEIIESIRELRINGFSITDHDTVDGIKNNKDLLEITELDFIPGIEFGVNINNSEVHILGYYIDIYNEEILNIINLAKNNRIERTKKILRKLNEAGIIITDDELREYSHKDIISRSHIANILVDKGLSTSVKNAFKDYLGYGGIAFVKKDSLQSTDIIKAIKNSGGVAILAHPGDVHNDDVVLQIIEEGIDGLEIINSKHSLEQIELYYDMACKYNLIQTCGSDCHGKDILGNKFIGRYTVNSKNINRIKALHKIRA